MNHSAGWSTGFARSARRWLAAAVVCVTAEGATAGIVYWNAGTASPTASPGVVGVSVGAIGRGNNSGTTALIDASSASAGYTFDLDGVPTPASGAGNFGAAALLGPLVPTTSTCFEVTVTPAAGSFSLEAIALGSRSTATGPLAWTLRSDADGYATDLATPGTLVNDSSWRYVSAVLTTVFTASVPTTFRVYGYGGTGTQSVNFANWRIDDVQLRVVPEPVPAAPVAGLVLCAGVVIGRRARAAARPQRTVAGRPASGSG